KICNGADKVGKVETETTFFNGLLGTITYGIYSPRQIRVYCN
ncbi:TPA: lipoprotein bor, partial [Mannheimia haemolytica]|nr:lipoprotein bor [Mannheimia haemolytica]